MANINSQKKRIRQDSKRNVRNKSLKSELKTTLKILENENKLFDISMNKSLPELSSFELNKKRSCILLLLKLCDIQII